MPRWPDQRTCGLAAVLVTLLPLPGCRMPGEQVAFSTIVRDFVDHSLALSPVSATSAGLHAYRGAILDDQLDDFSLTGIREQRSFYFGFSRRLESVKSETLSAQDRADLKIIRDQISLALLELNQIQSFRHNPTLYVELIGNALFTPSILEYSPKPERYRHIVKRLARLPILLEQARENLLDAPEVWNRIAQQENQGNIALIDTVLRQGAPSEVRAGYDRAAAPALTALQKFNDFLKSDLSKRTSSWRLGQARYDQKFRYTLETAKPPREVLADAEKALEETRKELERLAAPQSVPDALKRIAQQHATPETYLDEARRDLAEATAFVASRHLLQLPAGSNLQVIPTPEFMRGSYSVGGFNPAPPLEPRLGAFYWVTPIPLDWPRDRIESKLREYNRYGLQELTIHEAMPGHYVQSEYAGQVQPPESRLLRAVYGNVPYVEGWAVYAQQLMSDEGYLGNNRDLRIAYLKLILRSIANCILDIRFHTLDLSEQDALHLMVDQTYQEREEAVEKLQRAQLTSCQLPTYFVGWRGWLEAREAYRKYKGASFLLADFHERALKQGAVPLPDLFELLR